MLRQWRKEFARHLRAQGVPAKSHAADGASDGENDEAPRHVQAGYRAARLGILEEPEGP